MIILFVLVGVLLLGGGVATIIDGLPYLVLERGFTQVIVGTVVATGGILLLALSRVLAELRRVRTMLSNAMMAVSVATLAGGASASADGAGPADGSTLAAGTGLAVGAGTALVAGQASAAGAQAEDNTTAHERDEPDLFAQPRARSDEADAQADDAQAAKAEAPTEPQEDPASDEPAWLAGISPAFDRPTEAVAPLEPLADEGEHVPTATVAAEIRPESDTRDHPDASAADALVESVPEPDQPAVPWIDWPERNVQPALEAEPVPAKPEPDDDFSFLRERLAGRLTEPGEEIVATSRDEDPRIDAPHAETWMTSTGPRREPWFESAPARVEMHVGPDHDEAAVDSPALQPPSWPPQTRETSGLESAPEAGSQESPPVSEDEAAGEHEPMDASPVEAPSPQEPEPSPPAASDEGIVGAYQVGEAHFTIFADGSIKARTPDGDYSFASMEELKTYLASEKSRLGV